MTEPMDLAVVDTTSYNYPPDEQVELARRLTDAGIKLWLADQTLNWFPDGLWTGELTPIATEWRKNAFWDVYSQGAFLAGRVPGSRFHFSLDTVRRGPDVLSQLMLTLHEFTGGNATFALGAGEAKQLAPFGYEAPKPVTRLEESLRMIRELWSRDEPFDFDGKTVSLSNAQLGTRSSDGSTPPVFVVGAGPRLMKIGATLADGVMIWSPADQIPEQIAALRAQAREAGRDPDELTFWGGNPIGMVMTYDTEEQRDRMAAAPITKFIAAAWGRMSGAEWMAEGFEPPLGEDWHYAKDLIATEWPEDRVRDVIDKVPPEMVELGVLFWNEDDLARHFVNAHALGIGMLSWMDWGVFAAPEQRWDATDRVVRAYSKARGLV